jgi:alkanesulfonate monooxygenase SsuD/methylene tetrahydromethanopterin reductase-like flavin-dependent oxidoreductase (luciferase family)
MLLETAEREKLSTIRELVARLPLSSSHRLVVGSYEQVADEMQAWLMLLAGA